MSSRRVDDLVARDRASIAEAQKIRFFPFAPVAADGAHVIDADGRRLLDFTAGWAVANTGYGNARVRAAILAEVERGSYAGVVSAAIEPPIVLAERLLELTALRRPSKVWFGHSGSDANEALARLVRRATGRSRIITFNGAYHGSTDGSAALSGHTAQARWAASDHAARLPFPDAYRAPGENAAAEEASILELLERRLGFDWPPSDTAALLVEPIQSDGGILAPSPAFLRGLERICRDHDILLAVDEVKVGLGRTGEWFGWQESGIEPDLVVLGKALGAGLPLSAIVGPSEILDVEPSIALFTTAGNPIACAAALGGLDAIEHERLVTNAALVGAKLAAKLRRMAAGRALTGDVRGRGLVLGVELVRDLATKEPADRETAKVCYRAAQLGLAVFYVGMRSNVLEITPPLCLTVAEAEEGVEILGQAIDDVTAGRVPDGALDGFAGW
ncbi:MAG: aspartate aminotransferase family protein [Chloroflexota bacterium]